MAMTNELLNILLSPIRKKEISKLLYAAESSFDLIDEDEDPWVAWNFLQRAWRIYNNKLHHNKNIDFRIQDLIYQYLEKWPDVD